MNAIQILRQMHADTKMRFKILLGADDPREAAAQWQTLQSLLDLHEQMEDDFVYTPLFEEMGPGTPLGDWSFQHDADVAAVKQFIEATAQLDPSTPEWRATIGTIMDAMNKHVTDEEGQIFGRIEQIWEPSRLEQAGQGMQKMKDSATSGAQPAPAPARSARQAGAHPSTQARRTK